MFKKLSRSDALEDISNWSTNDVLCLLRKSGLKGCCEAIAKRQIGGDELLHLTEGKLALWKSDLTRPLIWSLWALIEEVRRSPEKFVEEKILETQVDDHLSDTESWDTDFDDEVGEDSTLPDIQTGESIHGFRNKQKSSHSNTEKRIDGRTDGASGQEDEGTYANCGSLQEEVNTYANCQEPKILPPKNTSKLHGQAEKSLAEQLKEQLKLMNTQKPATGPKPESLKAKKIEVTPLGRNQSQKSFLHNASKAKPNVPNQMQKRMAVPPPPEPRKTKDQAVIIEKPLTTLKNLDLVANLPAQTEGSDDEYESFDEQIIEQNQKKNIPRVDSKQSLTSGHQSSVESVYQAPSVTSFEEEEYLPDEIYQTIAETPDDNEYYLRPIQRTPPARPPPPLPAKPPQSSASPSPTSSQSSLEKSKEQCNGMCSCFYLRLSKQLLGGLGARLADEVYDMIVRIKRGLSRCCYTHPPEPPGTRTSIHEKITKMAAIIGDPKRNVSLNTAIRRQASLSECLTQATLTQARLNLAKRSPDKKSATLPHSNSNTSLSSERAVRSLPRPPEKHSYVDKPWYHNVSRDQATALIKEQSTYGNPQDGYFLLRPSASVVNNPLTLVLWYKDRVYNVPVRRRPDNRYALGFAKVNEQSFSSVEDIVMFYTREELVLHSGGVNMGSTKLTDTPPK
ncbi:Lymphocyte cytosolic protein 2 [Dufourea novaeangliae]|uniref:Lymphocyte cytosolic protein 2 n=1 Tax=Dufourea novaeangliae TaxID=178035 RepID=A0A154P213_DUFNO|nr:Lymphocyte cytosolic protein 2 [Dufourea novaeangliae]